MRWKRGGQKMTEYEMIVGLEVHAELDTKTKLFCGCAVTQGAAPNSCCCPVCMGMPGTLPVLNRQAAVLAVRAGRAFGCDIAPVSVQDRKNYFYPDLPKAYQISQYDLPLCVGGAVTIQTDDGKKKIGLTRIHLEEDAGKLIHDTRATLIDCNRCGIPLIEIVSEPEIHSATEAVAYLKALRDTLVSLGVSKCEMNRGQMRCDINLSVRKKGDTALGTRTEIKNLNSFKFAAGAIRCEFERQCAIVEAGGQIRQETRRYDPGSGRTFVMRTKEDADDYRYFPDPDLPIIETAQLEG